MSRYYSDNPVRDAERWLDDELEYTRRLPVCSNCGDPIYGEHVYLDPESMELYCTDCQDNDGDSAEHLLLVCTENFMED